MWLTIWQLWEFSKFFTHVTQSDIHFTHLDTYPSVESLAPLWMVQERELEGNVLLEPAAAMNQILVLKCCINVDTGMLSEILPLI